MRIKIDTIGGNCPVQATGTVGGLPFYFRSRYAHWSMSIGGTDVIGNPDWFYQRQYGIGPDAGWITEEQARAFIAEAVAAYDSQYDSEPTAYAEGRP